MPAKFIWQGWGLLGPRCCVLSLLLLSLLLLLLLAWLMLPAQLLLLLLLWLLPVGSPGVAAVSGSLGGRRRGHPARRGCTWAGGAGGSVVVQLSHLHPVWEAGGKQTGRL